jgi:hypothetical protein
MQMTNMKQIFVVIVTLLVVSLVLMGCTKKAVNEAPEEQTEQGQETAGNEPSALPSEQLPTGEATAIDSDLNQEEVDSDVADLEQTLSDW